MSGIIASITWENMHHVALECEKFLIPVFECSAVTAVASYVFTINSLKATHRNINALRLVTEGLQGTSTQFQMQILSNLPPFSAPFPLSILLSRTYPPSIEYLIDWGKRVATLLEPSAFIMILAFKVTCVTGCLLAGVVIIRSISAKMANKEVTWKHWEGWVMKRLPFEIVSLLGYAFLSHQVHGNLVNVPGLDLASD